MKVRSILGVIEVSSPYMRNPRSGETARPVKARLGIRGGSKTTAVERALADFGAEESFALAAQRFEEHYGQEVGRTSVLRVVAEAMGFDEDSRPSWVRDVLLLIDEGHVAEVVDLLKSFAGRGEERVHRLAGYIDRFSDALDYRRAHDKGVPLGSGEVESAHRYIPQKRLKLPGACWSPDTINSMLALRVLRANGWWEDFWQHRQVA